MFLFNNTDRTIAMKGRTEASSFEIPSRGFLTLNEEQAKEAKTHRTIQLLIEKGYLLRKKGKDDVIDTVSETRNLPGYEIEQSNVLTAENGAKAATIATEIKDLQKVKLND